MSCSLEFSGSACSILSQQYLGNDQMGRVGTKPVFGGLPTTKAQTNLRVHADRLAPMIFAYWEVSYLDLLRAKFQFSS